ncbi:MAG: hypothetical protein GXY54_09160 [Deltaproteobacteria bacterium]|nr:hypothetical protein [Deltaproteobacteria bacterium]
MNKKPKMETRAGMIAKEILKENDGDWLQTALKMFVLAKDDHELMREIVDPMIADKVYEALERIAPINFGGKSLLTCPLTTCDYALLRDVGKAELDREIAYFEENLGRALEMAAWYHYVMAALDENRKVREQFSVEELIQLRQKFKEVYQGKIQFFISEFPDPIKKLTLEAVQKSQGDWMLALQLMTKRVLEDSQALAHLMGPFFFSALWQVLHQASETTLDMTPPMNSPLTSGWIFGDSTRAELKMEVIYWEESARFLLRKARWLGMIRDAIGESKRVHQVLSEMHVKKFWNDAYMSVK